ncbi:PREDICTED: E3 ubiquitin protein ligase DRIP2-like [Lupinus angustifolius]|uniref:E3 ubiquitin protein ligase DRIP2-like n=1 Tax=Lupinus angustifolius TaxID=3871 RepID=UPI00092F8FD2|nr:PREDICTED: E3 ubiquitin protein ligase DRIP2-like [Lupinus angustifolius]XP_019454509.1 PREDICTED: E3 ubiquitin protein ligase DRIP2-like [Lupinus angustifolius]
MANQTVKVRRDKIVACMTCTICNNLFKDATTISECLHTFCRKCICDKITDEELECCPICDIDLGCVPLEKLRPDHSLQDVRSKIFPLKGRKPKAPEVIPSEPLTSRRKERSLSSLVVSTPRVSSSQVTMTGRRTKPTRKASGLHGSSFSIENAIKKEEELLGDHSESSSSHDSSSKFAENTGQSLSPCEGSESIPNKETENGAEPWDAKLDLWKPLNCLVEVASRTKSFKSSVQGSDAKLEPLQANESDSQVKKAKNKENKRKAKVEDEKISTHPVSPDTAKPKKLRRIRRKKEPDFGQSRITLQAVVDSNCTKLLRTGPIWFSLVASENQEGDAPLPQIPSSFVRIKDGNIPVSFIQKYLMKKLELNSEAEVEIKCMGQTVLPTLKLHNLVELWLQTTSSTSHRISATIGSTAKDFVMVLAYARKLPHPSNSQF